MFIFSDIYIPDFLQIVEVLLFLLPHELYSPTL